MWVQEGRVPLRGNAHLLPCPASPRKAPPCDIPKVIQLVRQSQDWSSVLWGPKAGPSPVVEVVWTQCGLVFHRESRQKALMTATAISWVLTRATVSKHYAVSTFVLLVQVQGEVTSL